MEHIDQVVAFDVARFGLIKLLELMAQLRVVNIFAHLSQLLADLREVVDVLDRFKIGHSSD